MSYLGQVELKSSEIRRVDVTGSTSATHTLTWTPASEQSLIITINGIKQQNNYSISGTTLTLDDALISTDAMEVIGILDIGEAVVPPDDSITNAMVKSDAAIALSKLNVTGTGSSSNFLRGDGSWQAVSDNTTQWQSVTTGATLTAVAGRGYPIDTTSNACTVTLPASASVGDTIEFTDYARKFAFNALTINQNSLNYQGNPSPNPVYDTTGESIRIVYMDATKGWIPTNDGAVASEVPQTYSADMLIVGGGGGCSGDFYGGGGGAGGFRTSTQTLTEGAVYTATVGDGGAGNTDYNARGDSGDDSSISGTGITTITSTGGGGGGAYAYAVSPSLRIGKDGGSGGGGGGHDTAAGAGGSGNTPSTSPSQGNDGGTGETGPPYQGAGGGGAGAVGADGSGTANGGNGSASSITGSSVTYAGGGGGAGSGVVGSGGTGGGGDATLTGDGDNGTVNLGGGGGATGGTTGGSGGKGVVILNVSDANYSGTVTGSPTVTTGQGAGSDETVIKFTGDGTYTA